jgi:hypothetical protein
MKNRRPHEIAIDRITLPPGTVGIARVRAAIERELARLVAAGPAEAGAAQPAATVQVKPGANADAIGVAVARQIHKGMKQGTR